MSVITIPTSTALRKGRNKKNNKANERIANDAGASTESNITAEDVKGAIFCKNLAELMITLPVEFAFPGHGSFTGVVTGFSHSDDFNGAILHQVTFSDGDKDEYSYEKILQGHDNYQRTHCPGALGSATLLPGLSRSSDIDSIARLRSAATAGQQRSPLPIPISFQNYPIRLPHDNKTVQGRIAARRVTNCGFHEWRIQLPEPYDDVEHWIDTQQLHAFFSQAKKHKISPPTKATPTLRALKGFIGPFWEDSNWTTKHDLVGLVVCVHLDHNIAPMGTVTADGPAPKSKKHIYSVTIEAAFVPDPGTGTLIAPTQFWGRLHDDLTTSVIFSSENQVIEGMFSHDSEIHNSNSYRKRRPNRFRFQANSGQQGNIDDAPVDVSFDNAKFISAVTTLKSFLPKNPSDFFGGGFSLVSTKMPNSIIPTYRRCLGVIARGMKANPLDENYFFLFLLFDAFILAPFGSGSFRDVVRQRCAFFLAGDWEPLFKGLKMRNTSSKSEAAPWSGDPADNAAMRAQKILSNSHDVGAAARALRAPKNPTRMSPGQLTQTFRNLNPQTGDPAPVIPPNPGVGQGGGDDPSYHTERQQHFPRGSININSFDEPATVRRTLAPPAELKTPKSISFTTAQIIRRIRRASTASAGGLSGTTYRVLRHWFHDHDETSDDLTCVINLIAAGNVPRTLIPLLTAGRGIAIPKNENGDLRPIVIGHVILRLIGSLSVTSLSDDIQRFFLLPNAMQFGVGVAGGCEIMVAAISTHLENFPEHIDVAGDARNAFNSWCRSKIWHELHKNFPSLYAFVKLVYGDASDILFSEFDSETTTVRNSVGSRQGCSLGSFLYCLAIHGLLLQMQHEFPDLLILAFCDDVHFVGDPSRAVAAYKRWAYLYASDLQGELRDDKGIVFSPTLTAEQLHAVGLPSSMPVNSTGVLKNDGGVRLLGAPIGNISFKRIFSKDIVASVISDMDMIGRMPSFQSQHLITTKSVVHKIVHLLRCIPGGEIDMFGDIGAEFDLAILSVLKRITRNTDITGLPRSIAQLPMSEGGLGYRLWTTVADAAFVSSYVNSSEMFPKLFPNRPYLSAMVPDLRRACDSEDTLSEYSSFAVRAFKRLAAASEHHHKLLIDVIAPEEKRTIRGLQHAISTVCDRSRAMEVRRAILQIDIPQHPWRAAQFNSNCGDPISFGTVPTDNATRAENCDFEIMVLRRLLLPTTTTMSENPRCPVCHKDAKQNLLDENLHSFYPKVDLFGNHALACMKDAARTKFWHDPLKRQFLELVRMAGISGAKEEVANILITGPSQMRADVAFTLPGGPRPVQYICDIRTCDAAGKSIAKEAAYKAGSPAEQGQSLKNYKWKGHVESQGDIFMALCVESGGRMGDQVYSLINLLKNYRRSAPAEQEAFSVYALQRLHLTSQIGVARIIRSHEPIHDGPCIVRTQGEFSLSVPMPRPLGNAPKINPREASPPWLRESFFSDWRTQTRQSPHHDRAIHIAHSTAPLHVLR